MFSPPNALAIIDEHGRVQYILGQNKDVWFARHVEEGDTGKIAVHQSSVARNAHLLMHYECTPTADGFIYLTDVSSTGTYVRLYENRYNQFNTPSNSPGHVHTLKGVHSRTGAEYAAYTVASFVDSARARILLGDLYSDAYFQLRDADKMFFEACLNNDTYKAYSLIYPSITDSQFLSADKIQAILQVCIEMSNIKLLKLLFLIWPTLTFPEEMLHNAVTNASVVVFKLLLSKRQYTNDLLNRLIWTAVKYNNLHVVVFIGYCCAINVTRDTTQKVKALTLSDLSTTMAFQLFAGQQNMIVNYPASKQNFCTSLFILAFMSMPQINPGYIIQQVQNGKWTACGKYRCKTCTNIVKTASLSSCALLDDIAGSFFNCKLKPRRNGGMYRDHFYTMTIPPVVFVQYMQPFILRQVKTRGLMNKLNYPMFSAKSRSAILTFLNAQHRTNCIIAAGKTSVVPAIPIELQHYILSFVRHCDWKGNAIHS
jgi:hypothetical protein